MIRIEAVWLCVEPMDMRAGTDTTLALGFVSGVHDLHAGEEICAPDRMRARELLQAVREWMRDHPDLWGASGAKTVRRALSDKYPCHLSPDDNTSQ